MLARYCKLIFVINASLSKQEVYIKSENDLYGSFLDEKKTVDKYIADGTELTYFFGTYCVTIFWFFMNLFT